MLAREKGAVTPLVYELPLGVNQVGICPGGKCPSCTFLQPFLSAAPVRLAPHSLQHPSFVQLCILIVELCDCISMLRSMTAATCRVQLHMARKSCPVCRACGMRHKIVAATWGQCCVSRTLTARGCWPDAFKVNSVGPICSAYAGDLFDPLLSRKCGTWGSRGRCRCRRTARQSTSGTRGPGPAACSAFYTAPW